MERVGPEGHVVGVDLTKAMLAPSLSPFYDDVVRRGADALRDGGRFAVAERHTWESVRRHLLKVHFVEYFLGAIYLSVGERATA